MSVEVYTQLEKLDQKSQEEGYNIAKEVVTFLNQMHKESGKELRRSEFLDYYGNVDWQVAFLVLQQLRQSKVIDNETLTSAYKLIKESSIE